MAYPSGYDQLEATLGQGQEVRTFFKHQCPHRLALAGENPDDSKGESPPDGLETPTADIPEGADKRVRELEARCEALANEVADLKLKVKSDEEITNEIASLKRLAGIEDDDGNLSARIRRQLNRRNRARAPKPPGQ